MDFKQNDYSKPEEKGKSFLWRFYRYQKERFPILGHGLLVASFSFSAIAYSRICRGAAGFVPWSTYGLGVFITVSFFLLVRIFDEFKDAEDDASYRKELPVPRGLVSLKELLILGVIVVLAQFAVILIFFPKLLVIWLVVLFYLCLMGKEFFIPKWLKKHQFWYVTSHMFIIPLIDILASGLDWALENAMPSLGLGLFFLVSYFNGMVLEIGRKIRIPDNERVGVLTYSSMLGLKKALFLWLGILTITLVCSLGAVYFVGYGMIAYFIFGGIFIVCSIPAWLSLNKITEKRAKMMEYTSALWTILMYLSLGAIPMIQQLLP
ncbi:UbiA family prenyltransferase [Fluviicola sp.]|uniref:UbiA family prenyltransferase n=1 Tax=Fluviicola sp. TaxID=1917219 RepID=UPI003D267030